jgi:hypothetical protein
MLVIAGVAEIALPAMQAFTKCWIHTIKRTIGEVPIVE